MRSFRHERSRLLDVLISVVAGGIILFAINVRPIWQWVRDQEQAVTGHVRLTDSVLVRDGVDILDRWLRSLEMHAYDQRLALRARFNPRRDDPTAAEQLLFVEIDDSSLARYGRWPWSRALQAEVIATLKRLGCRGVLTDIEFPEPGPDAPGALHPDLQLANALGAPSEGPRYSPSGLSNGAAFGISYLELAGAGENQRRIHLRRRLLAWALHAAPEKAPHLPEPMRRELVATGEADPDAAAARALAMARLIHEQPLASQVDGLLSGAIKDLVPPPVPPDLVKDAPTHFALILQAVFNAVATDPDGKVDELAKRALMSLAINPEALKSRGEKYMQRYLPELIAFCKAERAHIATLEHELDEMRVALFESWYREFKRKSPAVTVPELAKLIRERLKIRPQDSCQLADLVVNKRASLDVTWARDLHAPPSGNLLERLPVMGQLVPPIPALAAVYRGIGVSTVERDEGGVVRSQRLVFRVESSAGDPGSDAHHARLAFHASIPALGFLRDLDLDRAQAGEDFLRLPSKRDGGEVVIPIDRNGRTIIDFRGKWHEDGFAHVNAGELLQLSERWREREGLLRGRPEYGTHAVTVDLLRRWTHPRGTMPLPADGAFAPVFATLGDTVVDLLTREPLLQMEEYAKHWFLELGLNVSTYLEVISESRASGNLQDLEEAATALQAERPWYDTLISQLPQLEAKLQRMVRGRFCLMGVTSTATTDVSSTPLQEQYVNIGVHANLIDQMLRGVFVFRPPWTHVDMWILLAYLTLVPLVLPALSIRWGFITVVGLVLCHMAVSSTLMIYRGIWIDATTPVLALFAAYTLITIRRYIMEERSKNQIRGMFSTYLDKRVVELMLADDAATRDLGGTTREITAFFSDIEGFTTISELLDPDELSDMLQRYLTPMTECILTHGGLRDKYIGDAIVAIFGAPYPSTDHASQACLAAIEQVEKLGRLKQEWLRDEVPWYRKIRGAGMDLNFRIGLNTGRAKVGNFGAEHAKNYTMIGDSVNLAARLEGANKAYKSRIMVSETTYAAAREVVEARELDLLRVVGKVQPVTVFEVLGRKGEVEPARVAMAAKFAEALALYRGRHFDQARGKFVEIFREFPEDGPARTYLKRLDDAEFLASLPADWDGAFVSKEK